MKEIRAPEEDTADYSRNHRPHLLADATADRSLSFRK